MTSRQLDSTTGSALRPPARRISTRAVIAAIVRRVQRILIAPRKRSTWVLLFGVFAIVAWQTSLGWEHLSEPADKSFAGYSGKRPVPKYQVTASRGAQSESAFFFLYYHLGLYPLASDLKVTADTGEEAERLLHSNPRSLKQEERLTFRSREHGRIPL